jgi:hypothetical protein
MTEKRIRVLADRKKSTTENAANDHAAAAMNKA